MFKKKIHYHFFFVTFLQLQMMLFCYRSKNLNTLRNKEKKTLFFHIYFLKQSRWGDAHTKFIFIFLLLLH